MASTKSPTKSRTPGVADGKAVTGIPTSDGVLAEDRVKALFSGQVADGVYDGWASKIFSSQLTLLSATATPHGRTVFAFTVRDEHCNRLGTLHGGCTATLFDACTTAALAPIARPGFWALAGVSRTLNVTYLRPAPVGEEVLVESDVVHAGKRMCLIKGVLRRRRDGEVLATCEHGKASIDPEVAKL